MCIKRVFGDIFSDGHKMRIISLSKWQSCCCVAMARQEGALCAIASTRWWRLPTADGLLGGTTTGKFNPDGHRPTTLMCSRPMEWAIGIGSEFLRPLGDEGAMEMGEWMDKGGHWPNNDCTNLANNFFIGENTGNIQKIIMKKYEMFVKITSSPLDSF